MTERKVWLITGAGRGLGVDIVKAVLAAGHAVVATGRDASKVAAAVGRHNNLLAIKLDVTRPQDPQAAVEAAVAKFGRIDVLVNNAGNFFAGFFEELSAEQLRNQIEALLFGPMNVTRAVLPVMPQAAFRPARQIQRCAAPDALTRAAERQDVRRTHLPMRQASRVRTMRQIGKRRGLSKQGPFEDAQFLNIDLDVRSRRSLAPLVAVWPWAYQPLIAEGRPHPRWLISTHVVSPETPRPPRRHSFLKSGASEAMLSCAGGGPTSGCLLSVCEREGQVGRSRMCGCHRRRSTALERWAHRFK